MRGHRPGWAQPGGDLSLHGPEATAGADPHHPRDHRSAVGDGAVAVHTRARPSSAHLDGGRSVLRHRPGSGRRLGAAQGVRRKAAVDGHAAGLRRRLRAARKVADGNFEQPIPISAAGQLGQLARTFNEMQRRLAELDSARKQFIANASHELRTPIFSLGGFVELLEEEDPSPEERAEFVRTMREQIVRLTKLTADLLDLSQLDAGAVAMKSSNVDLGSLAREVAREFGPRADRRGSRLELRTPDLPVIASADPDRVRQVIRILLDNALTHTPEGTKVPVTTYSVNRRAELTVSDDGLGIPRRVQSRIFERFYTADSAGGSGLGLVIAREIAQRMEGRVAIASSKRFTAFTLDLPRSRAVAVDPAPAT